MGRDRHLKRTTRSQSEADAGETSSAGNIRPAKRKFNSDKAQGRPPKLAKQVWKGRDNPRNEHYPKINDGDSLMPVTGRSCHGDEDDDHEIIANAEKASSSSSLMKPEKHVLELVLDTLQRRDTYELFAEPVNPDEVEDYYEIIKEPMDFGTMRAKLHEGMYQNLQQFKNDVFLIPENAMNFNSSTTTYYRQARAIHELAKKVFHALKTDPENFVSEFSGTRRRSMRKALSELKDSRLGTKGFPKETSTVRKSNKKASGCATESATARLVFCPRSTLNGNANGQMLSSQEADRCFEDGVLTMSSFNNEDTLLGSTSFNASKRLILMNQGEINYMDSLISFVKDLGPIAQMVARRKFLGAYESSNDSYPNLHRFLHKAIREKTIGLTKDQEGENGGSNQASTSNIGKKESTKVTGGSNKVKRGLRDTGKASDDNVRPIILALENSHPKGGGEYKIRNKKGSSTNTMLSLQKEAKKVPSASGPLVPVASQFAFDLPFLKARLDKMNATPARIGLPPSR